MPDVVEVVVATIGRPHGVRGELTLRLATDEPERRLAPGAPVTVDGRAMTVAGLRWNGGVPLLGLEGVHDRTAAEALRGAEVVARVPAAEAPAEDDEFYDRQLVGLAVRREDGTPVGRLLRVLHLPAQDLLVVDVDGLERLVPFVTELVPEVDLDAGFVRVADLPGLLADEDE